MPGSTSDAYIFLTAVSGWLYFGLFTASALTLAVLITSLNRDYHPNFSDAEQTTRTLNQLLTLVLVSFALLESILTPTRVLDGHSSSSSLFHLTHVPKNTRVGLYMLAMATVEPHLFNMFYDSVAAEIHSPINWTFADLVGSTDTEFEGIKIAILEKGPMPKLYEHFIDDDFERLLMISRMFLFIGGLMLLPLSILLPHDVSWDSKRWGYGNQRWYEKALPEDPDLEITGFSRFWVGGLNIVIGLVKGVVPLFGIMFHANEFRQHRDDPAHDDAEARYDFYDPFHFNHTVHSVAMLAFASYLAYDAFRHVLVPLLGSRYKNRVRNYAVIHLFTLSAHVYLVSTMVDANGPETSDGDEYVTSNWIFVGAHASLYFFQEFGIAPWVTESSIVMTPVRYVVKWVRIFLFSDFIVDRYMSMLQTVASVTGMLAVVLLVIGINGPWLHAQPIPGTVLQEFSKILHETEHMINITHDGLHDFFNHIENTDLFKQLSCSFTDKKDTGTAGADYMYCDTRELSTWMKGHWHPCDKWKENGNSDWSKINMDALTSMSMKIGQFLDTRQDLIDGNKDLIINDDNIPYVTISNSGSPMTAAEADAKINHTLVSYLNWNTAAVDHSVNPFFHDDDNNACTPDHKKTCFCGPGPGAPPCVIPMTIDKEFREIVHINIVENSRYYSNASHVSGVEHDHEGQECAACHDPTINSCSARSAGGCSTAEMIQCGQDNCPTGVDKEKLTEDIFAAISAKSANPWFGENTDRWDPVAFKNAHSANKRWDMLYGTHDTYRDVFWGGENGHKIDVEKKHMNLDCMRQCNGCDHQTWNHWTGEHTLDHSDQSDCDNAIVNHHCECHANGINSGTPTEKRPWTDDTGDRPRGFCTNMKRCLANDRIFQTTSSQAKDRDKWNHLRYNNNKSMIGDDGIKDSVGSPDWNKFEAITNKFYNNKAMTTNTLDPSKQNDRFSHAGGAKNNNWSTEFETFLASMQLHDKTCCDTYSANLKNHDIFCTLADNSNLDECKDSMAELDNFASSTFMLKAERDCRTGQCDVFLVMMAIATAMKAAAMAINLFPFGGGDIGDMILAAEEALEWSIRMIWRFFQFGLRMYRSFRTIVKRIDYYWLLVKNWAIFIVFDEFIVTVTMKMMASFLHVLAVGFVSFFIAFWKRQRLVGRERTDVFNIMILFMFAGVTLGACVTVFLALTPWAINWLLDEILTFHHETNFVKNAFVDVKLVEDVGYVFIVLSSVAATYSAFCWLVLLVKQKEEDIRSWVLNILKWGAPYEFKNSITGRGTTVANTGLGAWIQTAVVMGLVVWIIVGAFDIVEEDGKWLVKGAVFHVDKYTDNAFVDRVAKFFKTNSLTSNYGDIDDNHSSLCDLIGQAIKELFLDILKVLLEGVSDVVTKLTTDFSPGLRFLYSAIKRDFNTIMFDAEHAMQLLVVFAPPITCVVFFLIGVTGSVFKLTSTSEVWVRNSIFIVSINGIAYTLALQSIADTFDEFKIPIFGYRLEFTTAIFKSQICSFLCFMSWVQWRFDEKVPLCYDKTCGELEDGEPNKIPMATPVTAQASGSLRLRMSSLQ